MSLIRSNQLSQPGSYTGSLQGTASWANNATTASYAQTASYVNPLNQNVIITGSIYLPDNAHSIYFSGSEAASRLTWNNTDGTLDLGLKGGNVTLQIGQEEVVRVVNKTGINLTEAGYQAVRLDGAQGNRVKVALAKGDADGNSLDTLGLVTEDIALNAEGYVTTTGLVRGINTTGNLQGETWTDGDALYLSPTTAGGLTKFPPTAPSHSVRMGYVVQSNPSQGSIYVKVDNGYELDELHNVAINDTTLAYGDLLMRDGGVWINTKQLSGSYQLTGSLRFVDGGLTGSVFGTASWANNANNAISSSYAGTASVLLGSITSASYASTSSWALNTVSSSYALTASYLNTLNQNLTFNGNLTLNGTASISYLNISYESASIIYSSGSNQFGDAANDTQTLYGSVVVPTGSLTTSGSVFVFGASGSTLLKVDSNASSSILFVTGSGRVGIGTSTPLSPLHIQHIGASGVTGSLRFFNEDNSYTGLLLQSNATNGLSLEAHSGGTGYVSSNSSLKLTSFNSGVDSTVWMGNGSRFRLSNSGETLDYLVTTTAGNVGVGTRNATAQFHVSGSINSGSVFQVDSPASSNIIYVTGSGNVGIGTNAPNAKLDVAGSIRTSTQLYTNNVFSSAASNTLLNLNGTTSVTIGLHNANMPFIINVTTGAEIMRISGSGNVGIGTANPSYRLDVSGSGNFTNDLTVTGSLRVTGSLIAPTITGSLQGTSSWAVSSSFSLTASYLLQAVSSSFAATASYVTGSAFTSTNPALSASYALTASYALNGGGGGTPGGSNTQIQYNNSNTFGGVPTLTYDGTTLKATGSFTGSFTGNLTGTASLATTASYALSSSYALNGGVTQIIAGTNVTISPTNGLGVVTINSSGGGGATFPYTGNAVITGSLLVSGSGGLLVTSQSKLADVSQVESLNWNVRTTTDNNGVQSSNWGSRVLSDTTGQYSVLWDGRTLYDASSNLSLEWTNRYMRDSAGATSIDWQNRILNDASGFYSIKWDLRQLTDTSGGNILLDYSYPHKVDINVPIQQKSLITAQEDLSSNGPQYWNGQAIEVASVHSGVALYDLCYLESDNTWYQATNANVTATRLLGIYVDSTNKLMLLEGDLRVNDNNNGNGPYIQTTTTITPGAPTYLGDAGAMTQIQPFPGDGYTRMMGYAYYSNVGDSVHQWMFKFKPSNDWYYLKQ